MPFPVLAVSTIILILTGASTTSYVYRDQIPALNEVLSALHNESSKAPTEIESGPSSPIEVLVDEDFPDVMKESSDLDSTVPVAAKGVNSADVKVKGYNYDSAKDSTSSDPVKEEPPKISTAQVQAIVADERQTVSNRMLKASFVFTNFSVL